MSIKTSRGTDSGAIQKLLEPMLSEKCKKSQFWGFQLKNFVCRGGRLTLSVFFVFLFASFAAKWSHSINLYFKFVIIEWKNFWREKLRNLHFQ